MNQISDRAKRPLSEGIIYAFGHQVASHVPDDPHSGDSGDLASDVMEEMALTPREQMIVEILAEHVHNNYQYTGEGEETLRKIEEGTL